MEDSKKIKDLLKIESSQPVEEDGSIVWKLPDGTIHREFGPAIIMSNGGLNYMQNGKLHREDGPAMITQNGKIKLYYIEGKQISESEFFKRK